MAQAGIKPWLYLLDRLQTVNHVHDLDAASRLLATLHATVEECAVIDDLVEGAVVEQRKILEGYQKDRHVESLQGDLQRLKELALDAAQLISTVFEGCTEVEGEVIFSADELRILNDLMRIRSIAQASLGRLSKSDRDRSRKPPRTHQERPKLDELIRFLRHVLGRGPAPKPSDRAACKTIAELLTALGLRSIQEEKVLSARASHAKRATETREKLHRDFLDAQRQGPRAAIRVVEEFRPGIFPPGFTLGVKTLFEHVRAMRAKAPQCSPDWAAVEDALKEKASAIKAAALNAYRTPHLAPWCSPFTASAVSHRLRPRIRRRA